MRLRLLACLAFLGSASLASRSDAGDPPPAPPTSVRVLEHDLKVRLIPAERRLIAEDRLLVDGGGAGGLLQLEMDRQLEWVGVPEVEGRTSVESAGSPGQATVRVPAGKSTVVVRYRGVVFDAVQEAGGLTWVAGDGTQGLISEKGVYLAPSSRWIPTPKDAGLAHFHVTVWVPAPFHAVTQGSAARATVVSAGAAGAGEGVAPPAPPAESDPVRTTWNVLTAKSAVPTDGLTLVAGPYEVKTREVEGVTIGTFLYAADAKDADLWLDATAEVVKRYAALLGPYPHPKFDVVENFFQTGYGMPAFTLLGDQVIQYVSMDAKRKGGRIPPGYVDHEYVHGWYGNGLFVDYATGNWCEALTTYCSNYLAKEMESVGEARAHRRGVLEKWSMRVKGAKDVPVRAFQEKVEDTDNDIGYGKGSLIFHLVRRQVGDEVFWRTVREFTEKRVGTVVSWDDWFKAFDDASGISVTAHVKPYLDRPGLPGLGTVGWEFAGDPKGSAGRLTLRAVQDAGPEAKPWPLFVPVRLVGVPDELRDQELDVSSGRAELTLDVPVCPREIQFDPDYQALRRIAEEDLPPCLERTLTEGAGGKGVVVLAVTGTSALRPLAEQIAKTKGLRVVGPEFDLATFDGPAVVLRVAPADARSVTVDGTTYDDPAISVLQSTATLGVLRTTYTALSEEAAARAGRVPFYGWDPWVVFRAGRPIARDPRNRERPSTRIVVEDSPTEAGRRVKDDVERLCSPEFEGRRPGTAGHDATVDWLLERLPGVPALAMGLPEKGPSIGKSQMFEFTVPRRAGAVRVIDSSGGAPGAAWGAVRAFSFSATGQIPLAGAVFVQWTKPSIQALYEDASRREGPAVYVLTAEAAKAVAPWLDDAASLTPETEAELRVPGRDGKVRERPVLETWISGRRARLGKPLPKLGHAFLALPGQVGLAVLPDRAVAEIPAEPVVQGTLLATVPWGTFKQDEEPGRNRRRCVLVTAHYDGFGKQGDALWVGADDNATGVACALEVARTIRTYPHLGTGPDALAVLVVLIDAEEWGLLGSRELVGLLAPHYDVRAVINVDSVGRAVTKPTHILGLSKHPTLARLTRNALEREGLVIGPDIDQYGYEHGSDHWPFHEAGIPAITLWASDYGVMNTAEDTPEKVEPEGVARIATALARLLRDDLEALVAPADGPERR